jgi:hypothetical protein
MSKKKSTPLITKDEALQMLSEQLRKGDLPANVANKTLLLYARLAGWGLRPRQADANPEPTNAETLQKQVIEAERKRKTEAQ